MVNGPAKRKAGGGVRNRKFHWSVTDLPICRCGQIKLRGHRKAICFHLVFLFKNDIFKERFRLTVWSDEDEKICK
jgi:hypothetical protein